MGQKVITGARSSAIGRRLGAGPWRCRPLFAILARSMMSERFRADFRSRGVSSCPAVLRHIPAVLRRAPPCPACSFVRRRMLYPSAFSNPTMGPAWLSQPFALSHTQHTDVCLPGDQRTRIATRRQHLTRAVAYLTATCHRRPVDSVLWRAGATIRSQPG